MCVPRFHGCGQLVTIMYRDDAAGEAGVRHNAKHHRTTITLCVPPTARRILRIVSPHLEVFKAVTAHYDCSRRVFRFANIDL